MSRVLEEIEVILSNYPYIVSALTLLMTSVASIVALWVAVNARRLQEVRLRVTCGIRQTIGISDRAARSAIDQSSVDNSAVVSIVNLGHVDTQLGFGSFEISEYLCSQYTILVPLEGSRSSFPIELQRGQIFDIKVFDNKTIEDFAKCSQLKFFRIERLNYLQLYLRLPTGRRYRIYIEPELRQRIIHLTSKALSK